MFTGDQYEFILHEIKNSVCLIGSSLQLIEKQHPQVKDFRYWKSTMSDILELTQLFQEFSACRTFENIQKETVNMNTFFFEIQNDFSKLLQDGILCRFEIPFTLPEMEIDPLRIRNAILNLLKNAAEALGTDGEITFSANMDGKMLCIQIHDTGCGIPEENLLNIFTPMFTSKKNGTGLGLPISKIIIEAHGGSISCSSTLGQGSTFTILLPGSE